GQLPLGLRRRTGGTADRPRQRARVAHAPGGAGPAPGPRSAAPGRARPCRRTPPGGDAMKTLCWTLGCLLLVACSTPPGGQTTSAGDLRVELALVPDPPTTGENHLRVTLRDASGSPVDGARLAFQYDMPAMGAMPQMKGGGTTESLGNGRYSIRYPLQMVGDWTLTVGIEAPGHAPTQVRLVVSPPRKGFTLEGAGPTATSGPESAGPGKGLELSPYRRQLLGVRFATATRRDLSRSLRGFGRVEVDERQLADVTLKFEAYVESLSVAETGRAVRAG